MTVTSFALHCLRVALATLIFVQGGALAHENHEDHEFEVEGALGWTAAELRAGHDLPLSMSAVQNLARINAGLHELAQRDAAACRWMNQITGPETLAKQVQSFEANPPIKHVIESANMTVKDYLLTLHAVSETAITVHAAERTLQVDAAASARNIEFYRRNRAEIERLLDAEEPC